MYSNRKGIVFILLTSLLLGACQKEKEITTTGTLQTTLQAQDENYTLATVQKGTFATTFSSKNTQIIYQSDAKVTSNKKTTKLKELIAGEMDLVKKGDVLAILDIEVSKVDFEEKQLSLEQSKIKYQIDKVAKSSGIADMELKLKQMEDGSDKQIFELQIRKAKSQYDQYVLQTERSLEKQETAIKELEVKNNDNTIVAPFDGIVVDIPRLKPGDKINQGDEICHLVSTEHMLLGVKENGLLRYDMDVVVTTKRINVETELTGRVVAAKYVIPEDKWSELSYVALDDSSKYAELINGTVTTDYISIGNVLLVDAKGITTDSDKSYVSLYEDGQISKRYVVIGKSDQNMVWVLQGLSENQTVITK